jgi:lipoprotein-anchoring transpeptidase ErfK/SrfK
VAFGTIGRMRRVPSLLVALALLASACSSGDDSRPTISKERSAPVTTTTAPLPDYISLIAEAKLPLVPIYSAPWEEEPSRALTNPWFVNHDPTKPVTQVFLIKQRVGKWLEVYLPVRPNGTTGWVKVKDVNITQTPYKITVELAAHRITVYNAGMDLLQESVAVGKPSTPTPPGTYYLRVLLKAPDPNTVYGPYAYPLSGHSDVLTEFNGGDGELGIHGNDDESVLGQSVTAGCVRMKNASITMLASILPLGTPVEIVA